MNRQICGDFLRGWVASFVELPCSFLLMIDDADKVSRFAGLFLMSYRENILRFNHVGKFQGGFLVVSARVENARV